MENEMMDAVRNGDTKNLELLLEQGTDPNFEDRWGTALGNASVKGRRDICELLLYWGADPNLKNQYGETALADASQSGHTDIVRLLLDRGADINYRFSNASALMYASLWGNTDIVRLLLDRGANPNFVDERGKTALMRATDNNHTAIVRLLLDNGANPNFVDIWGNTALTRATDNGNTAIVTLLMRYMTTIRMQSLQRGKMTRRKLRTSMARKRSSTSQLGDRYGLGDDVIHRLNSHMTRPNLTDMIDEIPRNMTGSGKRGKRSKRK
jgi:ankyrin repeat protein